MPLLTGSRLGPYEVLSVIGAGTRATTVKRCAIALLTTVSLMTGPARASGESDANRVQAHVALAQAAAGQDHIALLTSYARTRRQPPPRSNLRCQIGLSGTRNR